MMEKDMTGTGYPVFRAFSLVLFLFAVFVAAGMVMPRTAIAETAAEIDRDVDSAIIKLYNAHHVAKELSQVAKGVLVFPDVVKAGFIVRAQCGTGALREEGKTVGYYNRQG
jgi:lipid-binding SYLF domain-containing protein